MEFYYIGKFYHLLLGWDGFWGELGEEVNETREVWEVVLDEMLGEAGSGFRHCEGVGRLALIGESGADEEIYNNP